MVNTNIPDCLKCLKVASLNKSQEDLKKEGLCPNPDKEPQDREHCHQIGGRIIPLNGTFRNLFFG